MGMANNQLISATILIHANVSLLDLAPITLIGLLFPCKFKHQTESNDLLKELCYTSGPAKSSEEDGEVIVVLTCHGFLGNGVCGDAVNVPDTPQCRL